MRAALWVLFDLLGFTAASMTLHYITPSADWWIGSMFVLGLVWVALRHVVWSLARGDG